MFKFVIVAVLLAILYSLGVALYRMARGKGNSTAMARALTLRIALSVGLFIAIIIAYYLGWIEPQGVQFLPTKD